MALVLKDRVKETTSTTGTGAFTLTGAATGFQSFSAAIGNGNTTFYAAWDGLGNWETGLGTYSSSGNTLARTTVYGSSNGGALVNFPNTPTVWCDMPASQIIYNGGTITSAITLPDSGTWTSAGINNLVALGVRDTSAAFDVSIGCTSSVALTATRTLTLDVANGARTLKLTGNATLNQDVSTAANPTFGNIEIASSTTGPLGAGATANILTMTTAGQSQIIRAWQSTNSGAYVVALAAYDGTTLTIIQMFTSGSGVTIQASGAIVQIKVASAMQVSYAMS